MTGEQMFLGIKLSLDATGMVSSASKVSQASEKMQDSITQTGAKAKTAFEGLSTQLIAVVAGMGGVAAAAKVAGQAIVSKFLQPATKEAASFESALAELRYVSKTTGDEFERLRDFAVKGGLESSFSPTEVAKAMTGLRAAGLNTDEALRGVKATLDLIKGSYEKVSIEGGAEATAAAMMKFRGQGEDVIRVMDSWTESTRHTLLSMDDLGQVMSALRTAPATLNASSAEVFALVGALKSHGMATRSSAMAVEVFSNTLNNAKAHLAAYLRKTGMTEMDFLNSHFTELSGQALPEMVYQIHRLGVGFRNLDGTAKSTAQLMTDLTAAAERFTVSGEEDELASPLVKIFGPRGKSLIEALKDFEHGGKRGSEAFMEFTKTLSGADGALRDSAKAFDDTTRGAEKLADATQKAVDSLRGMMMLPFLKIAYGAVSKLAQYMADVIEKYPNLNKALNIVAVAFVAVSMAAALAMGGMAAAVLWSTVLAPALLSVGGAAGVASAGLAMLQTLAAPILTGLAVVAGAILGVMVLLRVWQHLMESETSYLGESLRYVAESAKRVWEAFSIFAKGGGITDALKEDLDSRGLTGLVIAMIQVFTRLKAVWAGIKEGFILAFRPVLGALRQTGFAIGWVINRFMEMLTWFTGSDLTNSIDKWKMLGKAIGVIAAVAMTRFIVTTGIAVAKAIPRFMLSMLRLIGRMVLFSTVTTAKVIWAIVRFAVTAIPIAVKAIAGLAWSFLQLIARLIIYIATNKVAIFQAAVSWGRAIGIMIAQTAVLIWQWIVAAAQMIATWVIAVGKAIAKAAIWIARNIVLLGQFILLNIKAVLLAAAILLVAAAYTYAIMKAMEFGEKAGPAVFEGVKDSIAALIIMWDQFKSWGAKIGEVFVEAFKGNFEPMVDYIQSIVNIAATAKNVLTGGATWGDLKDSFSAIGINRVTQEQKDIARVGAESLAGGGTLAEAKAAMASEQRIMAMTASINQQNAAEKAGQAGAARGGQTVHIEKIELNAAGRSPEEAARLARQMAEQIAKQQDMKSETEFFQ